jgi:hypothetical protein
VLLLVLLLLIAKKWDDWEWEKYVYVPNVPYRPICEPTIEEMIRFDAPKRRRLDGPLHPRFRALLLENVRKLLGEPGHGVPYQVVDDRIMVSENEADGWGDFAEAQGRTVGELAKAWPNPPGKMSSDIPEHIRILVDSLRDESGFVDMRDCRLVKAVAIDGW